MAIWVAIENGQMLGFFRGSSAARRWRQAKHRERTTKRVYAREEDPHPAKRERFTERETRLFIRDGQIMWHDFFGKVRAAAEADPEHCTSPRIFPMPE